MPTHIQEHMLQKLNQSKDFLKLVGNDYLNVYATIYKDHFSWANPSDLQEKCVVELFLNYIIIEEDIAYDKVISKILQKPIKG